MDNHALGLPPSISKAVTLKHRGGIANRDLIGATVHAAGKLLPKKQRPYYAAYSTATFASPLTISSTFNSLFKVLFAFPSRYLFAISLVVIFSFRWNLPPFSALIPKYATQSARTVRLDTSMMNGAVTLLGAPFQETFIDIQSGRSPEPHVRAETSDWALSCSLFTRRY